MSWDIVLFSSTQKINTVENLDEEKLVPIDFDKSILGHFSSHKFDNQHVEIIGKDFSMDFFIDEELVSNKMISLYGENALFEIAKLAKIQNWQIYDSGIDKMLNLENASENGYANFQSYLNKILGK